VDAPVVARGRSADSRAFKCPPRGLSRRQRGSRLDRIEAASVGQGRRILTSKKLGFACWGHACLLGALASGAALGCDGDDAAELENREAARVCDGDRWVAGPADETALADCTSIAGNLSITGNELTSASLPRLTSVEGSLTIWGSPGLSSAALPRLARVGGSAEVSFNEALATLDLARLRTINDRGLASSFDLSIRENALTSCEASALAERLLDNGFRGTAQIEGNGVGCAP
jgi:hypothetical protein